MVLVQRLNVRLAGQRPFRLCFLHEVLTEVGHLAIAIALIEGDHVLQRTHRRRWPKSGEISVEVGFELVQQNLELRIVKLARSRNVSRIDRSEEHTSELQSRGL